MSEDRLLDKNQSGPESSDKENDEEDIEQRRARARKEQQDFLTKCANEDPEFAEAFTFFYGDNLNPSFNPLQAKIDIGDIGIKKTTKSKITRSRKDESFRFSGNIPTERRKSARLTKSNPEYNGQELNDVVEYTTKMYRKRNADYDSDEDQNDEDGLRYLTKTSKRFKPSSYPVWKEFLNGESGKRNKPQGGPRPSIINVEDVTEAMLKNISLRVKDKIYDSGGTSCHQCRQKTRDQKTSCRNPDCIGVQGQFCGVCIKNRYGEDCAEALLDPNWTCFVCRGICNCSFCRKKKGKVPTGILVPIALRMGHSNVNDFLVSLEGKYDTVHQENSKLKKRKLTEEPSYWSDSEGETEPFLGFDRQIIKKKKWLKTYEEAMLQSSSCSQIVTDKSRPNLNSKAGPENPIHLVTMKRSPHKKVISRELNKLAESKSLNRSGAKSELDKKNTMIIATPRSTRNAKPIYTDPLSTESEDSDDSSSAESLKSPEPQPIQDKPIKRRSIVAFSTSRSTFPIKNKGKFVRKGSNNPVNNLKQNKSVVASSYQHIKKTETENLNFDNKNKLSEDKYKAQGHLITAFYAARETLCLKKDQNGSENNQSVTHPNKQQIMTVDLTVPKEKTTANLNSTIAKNTQNLASSNHFKETSNKHKNTEDQEAIISCIYKPCQVLKETDKKYTTSLLLALSEDENTHTSTRTSPHTIKTPASSPRELDDFKPITTFIDTTGNLVSEANKAQQTDELMQVAFSETKPGQSKNLYQLMPVASTSAASETGDIAGQSINFYQLMPVASTSASEIGNIAEPLKKLIEFIPVASISTAGETGNKAEPSKKLIEFIPVASTSTAGETGNEAGPSKKLNELIEMASTSTAGEIENIQEIDVAATPDENELEQYKIFLTWLSEQLGIINIMNQLNDSAMFDPSKGTAPAYELYLAVKIFEDTLENYKRQMAPNSNIREHMRRLLNLLEELKRMLSL